MSLKAKNRAYRRGKEECEWVWVGWQETRLRADAGSHFLVGSPGISAKEIAFDFVSPKGAKARFKQMDDTIQCFRKITT